MYTKIVALAGLLAVALVATPAYAETIFFSNQLSDQDQPDAGVFDAQVNFSFDSGTGVLTIEILNQTVPPNEYELAELYFNVSGDVTSIAILNNGGLTGATLATNSSAGPFGTYEYELDLGSGNSGIAAGTSATLTFQVTGSNLDISDFFSGFGTGGSPDFANTLSVVKWAQGPNDDSVFAGNITGVVPEPSTMTLLGLGLAGIALHRRFRENTK